MILCVTPNPALDRTLIVPRLRPAEVHRTERVISAAGGKGLNVARAARTLGYVARCLGLLGGSSGRLVAELAEREGLDGAWTWIAGETRISTIVVDLAGGDATVFNEAGPAVAAAEWARLEADVLRAAGQAAQICLSGSLPPGVSAAAYAQLIGALDAAGRQVWVDTSGAALRAATTAHPAGIKVNGAEAGALLGTDVGDVDSAVAAAVELRRRGIATVVLTLGAQGAVLAGAAGTWWAHPPAVRAVSTVGSGDAFLAGLATGLAADMPQPEALRRAVASGAANALSPGGGRFAPSEFEAALAGTAVEAWKT